MPVPTRVALTAAVLLAGCAPAPAPAAETPKETFEKRILPIFKSPNPSSCVQCHLAGVDLKDYILPDHEKTFVSLRDQGLIDLDKPEKSRILKLISMGEGEKGGAALIAEKARKAEYEAFAAWIKASAADPKLRDAPKLPAADLRGPSRPAEVIRHDRKDRLLESFTDTVWAMRFRCMGCHTEGTNENKKHVEKFGARVAWFKATPEATLEFLRAGKLIDVKVPEKSLLLRKPLNEVEHQGGQKFLPGDQGYKAFRAFAEDYAKVVGDKYPDAKSLPADDGVARFGTESWLRLTNTPPAWADKLVQVDVYARAADGKGWEPTPVATSDRAVFGKGRVWQHTLTLLAAEGSDRAKAWRAGGAALPKGRYLVKVYVDAKGRLAGDWKATLGKEDFAGQVEVESAWPAGYGKMTEADAGKAGR